MTGDCKTECIESKFVNRAVEQKCRVCAQHCVDILEEYKRAGVDVAPYKKECKAYLDRRQELAQLLELAKIDVPTHRPGKKAAATKGRKRRLSAELTRKKVEETKEDDYEEFLRRQNVQAANPEVARLFLESANQLRSAGGFQVVLNKEMRDAFDKMLIGKDCKRGRQNDPFECVIDPILEYVQTERTWNVQLVSTLKCGQTFRTKETEEVGQLTFPLPEQSPTRKEWFFDDLWKLVNVTEEIPDWRDCAKKATKQYSVSVNGPLLFAGIKKHAHSGKSKDLVYFPTEIQNHQQEYLQLCACITHLGEEANSGHYVAYMKFQEPDGSYMWYQLNDDKVKQMPKFEGYTLYSENFASEVILGLYCSPEQMWSYKDGVTPVGIHNPSNYCYENASLQVLFHAKPFVKAMENLKNKTRSHRRN